MTDTQEIPFTNSSLQTTLIHTKEVKKFYDATEFALKKQPNSNFWKEAFELINQRNKKL